MWVRERDQHRQRFLVIYVSSLKSTRHHNIPQVDNDVHITSKLDHELVQVHVCSASFNNDVHSLLVLIILTMLGSWVAILVPVWVSRAYFWQG